jgi:two-component system response regulator MprA
LEFLMRSAGRACSRAAISDAVWCGELTSDSNLIEVYVQKLRGKLEVGEEARLLHSIRGVGYVMRCYQHGTEGMRCVYTACVAASN